MHLHLRPARRRTNRAAASCRPTGRSPAAPPSPSPARSSRPARRSRSAACRRPTCRCLSNTQIVAVTPAGAEGPADVLKTNVNGPSAPRTFVYNPLAAPVLTCALGAGNDGDTDGVSDAFELQFGLDPADGTDGALDSDARRPHQRPGMRRPDASARTLHALSGRGRHGLVLRHPRGARQPGGDTARRAVPLPDAVGQVVRHFLLIPATPAAPSTWGSSPASLSANVSTVIESDVARGGQSHDALGIRFPRRRARRVEHAGAVADWFLAEGATHGVVQPVLPAREPEPDAVARCGFAICCRPAPPIVRTYTVRTDTRRPFRSTTSPAWGRPTCPRTSVPEQRADHRRARDVLVGGGTFPAGHGSAGVTSPSRTGSSPKARPEVSSTRSCCWPTRTRPWPRSPRPT